MNNPPAETAAGPQRSLKQLDLARALGLGLLVVALWMATRPYQGIFHDSRFYTAEALNTLLPGRFSDDLYFLHGSQGRFTIFSRLYVPLISLLGLSGANIALTVLAQCLWLGGLCYLANALFRDWKVAGLAVAAAILLPSGLLLLPYGEPYVTPRSFAEALTFWALGSQLNGRPIRALALLGVSMLIHPLMTLPGVCVWFLYQAAQRRILWVLAAAAVAVVLGLALAGVQPFSLLLQRFDPAWLEILRTREDFCFVSLWKMDRWFSVGGCFALGFFELVMATPSERRVLVPIFAVGAGGLLASPIGGDLLHNVLLFDIQTWRFMWLFALVANLFAAKMFLRFAEARPLVSSMTLGLLGLAFVAMAIARFFPPLIMGAVLLLTLALFSGCWEWLKKKPLPPSMYIPLALLVGGALAAILIGVQIIADWTNHHPDLVWEGALSLALSLCISGVIGLFLFRSEHPMWMKFRPIALLLAFCFLAMACWRWDQRTPWNRFVDTSNPPSDLSKLLPRDAPIYWEGDFTVPWFLLKRASYFSCDQGTGALFSRDTAIAYDARYKEFEKLQTLDFRQYSFCPLDGPRRTTPLRRAELSQLCTREQGLGALVLTQRIADAPYRIWTAPARFKAIERSKDGALKPFSADHFYIYTCAELR